MPKWDSSLSVRRVSSHAMTSASVSTRRARGDMSSRLPMGVPHRRSLPLILSSDRISGFVRETNYAGACMGASREDRYAGETAWTKADWIAVVAVTGAAALIRLFQLSRPHSLVFDETYYARDACFYAEEVAPCGLEGPPVEVHPPLGKWLMSIGIHLSDYHSFGYRIVVALAGIATIA